MSECLDAARGCGDGDDNMCVITFSVTNIIQVSVTTSQLMMIWTCTNLQQLINSYKYVACMADLMPSTASLVILPATHSFHQLCRCIAGISLYSCCTPADDERCWLVFVAGINRAAHSEMGVPSQNFAASGAYLAGDNPYFKLPARTRATDPMASNTFKLTIPKNHLPGIHWFHPHQHGSSVFQAGVWGVGGCGCGCGCGVWVWVWVWVWVHVHVHMRQSDCHNGT